MSENPAINADLIRQYALGATEDGIKNLITLFDFQRRQMQRAEELCHTAWLHVAKVESRQITTLATTSTNPRNKSTAPTESTKPNDNSALELDL